MRGRVTEEGRDRWESSVPWLVPQMALTARSGQARNRILVFCLWAGPKYLDHLLLPPQLH